MSTPLEHDYIGLAEASSLERSSDKIFSLSSSSSILTKEDDKTSNHNLKETELRLGLPGFHDYPEKKPGLGVSICGKDLEEKHNNIEYSQSPLKPLVSVSGAKRGFFDAINGSSGKWVLSDEVDLNKSSAFSAPTRKDVVSVGQSSKPAEAKKAQVSENNGAPAAKAQVVGWPPIRSFRKNTLASTLAKNSNEVEGKSGGGCLYIKVSMDGAPYLRKFDLKTYTNYTDLSLELEKMFSCFTIGHLNSNGSVSGRKGLSESSSEYVLTYEDKDGDWMLVGDVPWEMFTDSCTRMRIMKGSEAIGLAPRAIEKSKNRN